MGEEQHEGAGARLLQKGHRAVGQHIGDIPLDLGRRHAVIVERVDRLALSPAGGPVVEPGSPGLVVPHVPLADKSVRVARQLQVAGEGRQLMAFDAVVGVVGDPVCVWVETGQQRCATRRTERRRRERVVEHRTVARQLVDCRRLHERVTAAPMSSHRKSSTTMTRMFGGGPTYTGPGASDDGDGRQPTSSAITPSPSRAGPRVA